MTEDRIHSTQFRKGLNTGSYVACRNVRSMLKADGMELSEVTSKTTLRMVSPKQLLYLSHGKGIATETYCPEEEATANRKPSLLLQALEPGSL